MSFQTFTDKLYIRSSIKHDNIYDWLMKISFADVLNKSSTYKGSIFLPTIW